MRLWYLFNMDGNGVVTQSWSGLSWLALPLAMVVVAVYIFIDVQTYLADPHRKEFNEAWFAQFESFMRSKYKDPELRWRADCFHMHFDGTRRG